MKLNGTIPTKEQYMIEVEKGNVNLIRHPENSDVILLNYTPELVYSRQWNDINIQCRGLILNEKTGEVLARPFPKFFNYGENPACDAMIPRTKITNNGYIAGVKIAPKPEITIKQDGSLGIMYRLDGKIRWATRGSFTSPQSQIAQQIWDDKYSRSNSLFLRSGTYIALTLMCEIIHPETKVVVPYDFTDLVLIGATNRFTGFDFGYSTLSALGSSFNLPVTKKVEGTIEEIVAKAKTLHYSEEGFVLRWVLDDGAVLRLKVKGDEYMKVHRIAYGLSKKRIVQSWVDGKLNDLITSVPEEFRAEIEELQNLLCSASAKFECAAGYIWTYSLSEECQSRKDYAKFVMEQTQNEDGKYVRGLAFLMYDNKETELEIRKTAAKWYFDTRKN